MNRSKIMFFLFIVIVSCSWALAEESISITTYYPSPYGVYNEMRLYPHDPPITLCDSNAGGTMFYNSTAKELQVCDGISSWLGSGVWARSGNDIYNTNSGKVGIGTETPRASLDVVGDDGIIVDGEGSSAEIRFRDAGTDSFYNTGDDYYFRINTTGEHDRLKISATVTDDGLTPGFAGITTFKRNGNVGIGTTDPRAKLHIQDDDLNVQWGAAGTNGGLGGHLVIEGDDAVLNLIGKGTSLVGSAIKFSELEDATGNYKNVWSLWRETNTAPGTGIGGFHISYATGGVGNPSYWHTVPRVMFTVAPDGNVGIGTSDPQSFLHVYGASSESEIYIDSPDSASYGMKAVDGGTGQTSVKRIVNTGTGLFWIEETIPGPPIVRKKIFVAKKKAAGTDFVVGIGNYWAGSLNDAYQLSVKGNLLVEGNIDYNGLLTDLIPSDIRLKDVKEDYKYGLNEIMKLRPIRYKFKAGNEMGLSSEEEHIGLIAQDVQKVIPEAVKENSSGYLAIDNNPINWAVINAIKDLEKQIEDLKAQKIEQQKQLEDLKAQIMGLKRN